MKKQQTIRSEVEYQGVGLHTGNPSKIKFIPAPINSGIQFVRTDIPGHCKIPAHIDYVTEVIRGTTLSSNEVQIHTVEHICSALLGLGIDNITIEITQNEPPVADGSSHEFAKILFKNGIIEQEALREEWTLEEPIIYKSNETIIKAEPAEEFSIDCKLLFDHPMIKNQEALFTLNSPENYMAEISKARTFCFDYEVEALKRKGLARGGSLQNAIVVGMDRIHNQEKTLRYSDEFVRHKILDFLGDLCLLGKPLLAKVEAVRVGHGHNINFVKKIIENKKSTVPS